jgi:hypothetical protein
MTLDERRTPPPGVVPSGQLNGKQPLVWRDT